MAATTLLDRGRNGLLPLGNACGEFLTPLPRASALRVHQRLLWSHISWTLWLLNIAEFNVRTDCIQIPYSVNMHFNGSVLSHFPKLSRLFGDELRVQNRNGYQESLIFISEIDQYWLNHRVWQSTICWFNSSIRRGNFEKPSCPVFTGTWIGKVFHVWSER